MKNRLKKIFALFIAVSLIAGLFPAGAFAAGGRIDIEDPGTGTWKAAIGNKKYDTFDMALDAAFEMTEAVTLTLCADDSTKGNILDAVTDAQTLTIDLKGHTLEFTGSDYLMRTKRETVITDSVGGGVIDATGGLIGTHGLIYNNSSETVTLSGGVTITGNTKNYILNAFGYNAGSFHIADATVSNLDPDGYAVRVYGGSVSGVFNGTFTISGGTVNGKVLINGGDTLIGGGTVNGSIEAGALNITGGFIGDRFSYSSVLITGGWFTAENKELAINTLDAEAGGMFIKDDTYAGYDGYVIYTTGEAMVVTGGKTAFYETIEEAFAAADTAASDCTITLIKDAEIQSRIVTTARTSATAYTINFDLGGHTLTYTGSDTGAILIRAYVTMNIYGGTIDVTGAAVGNIFYTNKNSSVAIKSGTYLGFAAITKTSYPTTLKITGGRFAYDPGEFTDTSIYSVIMTDGLYEVCMPDPEATVSINNGAAEAFVTADEAFLAATAAGAGNVVIELLGDATVSGGNASSQYIFGEGANITLNLNGHTLTRGTGTRMFRLNTAVLTINGDGGTVMSGGRPYTGANGAFVYVNEASALNLNDVTVSGFTAGVNASGTARSSGAVHIVKSGSTANLKNAVITGCSAANTGGAVTVASGCMLYMDKDSAIINCTAPKGGAIYLDYDQTTEAYGTADIYGNISGCVSTGSVDGEVKSQPIWSNGIVQINGEVLACSDAVYQMRSVAKIYSFGGEVLENVTAKIIVKAAMSCGETPVLKYYNGSVQKNAVGVYDSQSGTYDFEATVNVNQVASDMSLEVFTGDRKISDTVNVSVLDYLQRLVQEDLISQAQKTFAANLVVYADLLVRFAVANNQAEPGTLFTVPYWAAEYATDEDPAVTNENRTLASLYYSGGNVIKGATLNITEKISPCFIFFGKKGTLAVASIDGQEVGRATLDAEYINTGSMSDGFCFYLDRISPADYAKPITVRLITDGKTVCELRYSINAYCFAKDSTAGIGPLARAIYNYGLSALALR